MTPSPCRLAVFLVVFATLPLRAEEPDLSRLTLKRIHAGKEFEAKAYGARWLEDGSGYTRLEPSKETPGGQDLVLHRPEDEKGTTLVPAAHLIPAGEAKPLAIDDYALSKNQARLLIYTSSKRVWRQKTRGDYWILDRASRELRQLGGNAQPSTLMFCTLSPTGTHAAYVRGNNIYVEDLRQPGIRQITESGSKHVINGTFDWVYEEELSLRNGIRWSPDGSRLAYWQINTEGVREFALVETTASLYPTITSFPYPKVGQQNPTSRVGVVTLADGATTWMDVPGDPRDHYIARMEWADSSEELVLQQLNRLQNTNQVMLADARTGKTRTILTERDDAWLDIHDELKWFDSGKQFTWVSERDGWRHVYAASREGPEIKLITPGDLDAIHLLEVDESAGWVYFLASPDNPTQCYLYRVRLDGTSLDRLTPQDMQGTHAYQISPGKKWAIHTYSSFDTPPVTELVSLPDHKTIRTLEDNKKLREKLGKLKHSPTEFFRVAIADGVELDAWCMKPADFDPEKKYPLLVYVYGEPAGQTVLDRWGSRHHLWHMLLTQKGYLVMSFDNRGTPAPRGRAWRKHVHRKVGILAPQDQAAALKAVLTERKYLDADRVGIWGWSGGGSMSLNAIFRYPDLYRTAISIAPVCNQRFYDTIYQERYMGLPEDNVDGFIQGSPITHAHQLKGNLLLIHGTGDDNCHYQGTEALINELIRLNKQFRMFAYPNRTHAIREGANTTLHLRTLMTEYLEETLPAGDAGSRGR